MADQKTTRRSTLRSALRWPGKGWRRLRFYLFSGRVRVGNWLKRRRGLKADYIVMPVGGSLPERSGPARSFLQRRLRLQAQPLSLQQINGRLGAIVDADNVTGVVFLFEGFRTGLATLQNFRAALERLRAGGKQAIVYTPYLDLAHYWAASPADRIVAPPTAIFEVLGLRSQAVFLKDALDQIGVEAQVVRTTDYKTAYSALDNSDMAPEEREQVEWLLDDIYGTLIDAMAHSRSLEPEALRALVDGGPYSAEAARSAGLIDDIAYEDELAGLLAELPPGPEGQKIDKASEGAGGQERRASLVAWPQARRILIRKVRRVTRRYVGVVSLEGRIVMGQSRRSPVDIPLPFVGGALAGESTLAQLLRAAKRDRRMAALILHVDSGGGSALASDLIWREVLNVSHRKPVLVYMGNVAASGGYYVSAPGEVIMAQPLTLTGSIGVVMVRLVTAGLFEHLQIRRVEITRGDRIGLDSDLHPLDEEDRQALQNQIEESYERFKKVVAEGRELPYESLDPLCQGRVWTGRQALEKGLIDAFGDFLDAIRQAASLAGLPDDDEHLIATVNLYARPDRYLFGSPAAGAAELLEGLSIDSFRRLLNRPLALIPFDISFH